MAEIREAPMARDVKLMSLRTDGKAAVLRKLQGSFCFEKILPSTALPHSKGSSQIAMPTWFVEKHGDKIREDVMLRYQSSSRSWNMRLSIQHSNRTIPTVFFGRGWKDFASFHGFLEGDLVVFSLTATSAFDVYLIREEAGSPVQLPSRSPRKRLPFGSAPGGRRDRESGREFAMDHDKLDTMDGAAQLSGARTQKDTANQASALHEKKPRDSLLPYFFKKLVVGSVYRKNRNNAAYLEIPAHFWSTHGNRLHAVVKLQGIHGASKKRTVSCRLHFHDRYTRLRMQSGWNNFAKENNLEVGQVLQFTLTGDSFFIVRVMLRPSTFCRN